MAALLVGSAERVREIIKVTEADFAAYQDGSKEPTWVEFERLVQLVVDKQREHIEHNRAVLARIRGQKPGGA